MKRMPITLIGIAPILFNRFTDKSTEELRTGQRKKMTEEQRRIEAYEKVYQDENGLFIPGMNVKKCFLDGARRGGIKDGRISAAPNLQATVFFPEKIYFGVHKPDFIDERLGRRPPKKGAAVLIKRPGLNSGWRLSFTIEIIDDNREEDVIIAAFDIAGMYCGLGDYRPEFGRFMIEKGER